MCAHAAQKGFCGFRHDNGPYDAMLDATNKRPKPRAEREAAASSGVVSFAVDITLVLQAFREWSTCKGCSAISGEFLQRGQVR